MYIADLLDFVKCQSHICTRAVLTGSTQPLLLHMVGWWVLTLLSSSTFMSISSWVLHYKAKSNLHYVAEVKSILFFLSKKGKSESIFEWVKGICDEDWYQSKCEMWKTIYLSAWAIWNILLFRFPNIWSTCM